MPALRPLISILVLGNAALLAAAAEPAPALRDKPAPAAWKVADLNAQLPHPEDPGAVSILVWEIIDFGGVMDREERCLVVKRYAKPKAGEAYALSYLHIQPGEKGPCWKPPSISSIVPGEPARLVYVPGFEFHKSVPTDKEIAAFLKERDWGLKPGVAWKGGWKDQTGGGSGRQGGTVHPQAARRRRVPYGLARDHRP